MATVPDPNIAGTKKQGPLHPFRKAVLRGLGVVSPPLFTILIFLWVANTTNFYVLQPVTYGVQEAILWVIEIDVREFDSAEQASGEGFVVIEDGTYIPGWVYGPVMESPGDESLKTAEDYYRRYVRLQYLSPYVLIPCFLALFTILLYLLGKFMAAGIGHFFWNRFELGVNRLPLVRNVYSSVKQVSDFLFSEREIEYTRVVAVEYPRKGIWSLGMVTGESMLDIRSAANEPILSVLMPTSPMPVTGFTVTVLKSETIDLNITIDQAFQFIISCGVVVPPQQLQEALENNGNKTALASPDAVG